MKLKNVLIVVKDLEKSKRFYKELFGLETTRSYDGNAILSEGLVLQDEKIWRDYIKKEILIENNSCLIYFEERDIENFVKKLETTYPSIKFLTKLRTTEWGQRLVRFYDLDGNLIEVRTPD